jgi:hypothetical protein
MNPLFYFKCGRNLVIPRNCITFANEMMNEEKPLVSFILTYYNLPVQMLCECIDSILALSLTPEEREIIVVDDGSDTSPMNGLMQYGDTIIYVRQKHEGVSVARNTALRMAKGSYIQIVDGDDCLLKEPYEQCLDIIRQHPDAEVVMFDFTRHKTATSSALPAIKPVSGAELMKSHNIRGAVCCCLFRQSVRSRLEFTPGVAYSEDEEFTPQLLLRAEVVYATDIKAYYYRKHPASAVSHTDEVSIDKRLDDTKSTILNLHLKADRLPLNDRLALQRRVAQLTMDYIYNTMVLTRSAKCVDQRIEELRAEGLFPLPDQNYSTKYTWFRRMTNSAMGRRILLTTLPLMKKER